MKNILDSVNLCYVVQQYKFNINVKLVCNEVIFSVIY